MNLDDRFDWTDYTENLGSKYGVKSHYPHNLGIYNILMKGKSNIWDLELHDLQLMDFLFPNQCDYMQCRILREFDYIPYDMVEKNKNYLSSDTIDMIALHRVDYTIFYMREYYMTGAYEDLGEDGFRKPADDIERIKRHKSYIRKDLNNRELMEFWNLHTPIRWDEDKERIVYD